MGVRKMGLMGKSFHGLTGSLVPVHHLFFIHTITIACI